MIDKIFHIKRKINQELEKDGCKITNAHFEIGLHFHSDQYYFAQKYFQTSLNCDEFAEILDHRLKELNIPDSTTLVGYQSYIGLLLDKVVKTNPQYNYAIIEKDGDSFIWQHSPNLKKNLVIILPTTCTCSMYFRIKKFLERYKERTIDENFFALFLILEKSLENRETETINLENSKEPELQAIYSPFGWTEINPKQIVSETYKANSLVRLYSPIYLPENCPICFPAPGVSREKPLFPTYDNFEAPNLIFGFPNFSAEDKSQEFLKAFHSVEEDQRSHLYGHIYTNQTSYANYIRGNAFYKNNKENILKFFNDRLNIRLEEKEKKILFITSETKHNSTFLEDLSLENAFKNQSVTILRFQSSNEFVDNFISLHKKIITDEDNYYMIYFEEVMSAAKTFKLISNYIKHARNKELQNNKLKEFDTHGFDLVLTLVDRTPFYTKSQILEKIVSSKIQKPEEKFISFFRLNVPIISASHLANPLEEKMKSLEQMIDQCHLDSLKMIVGHEIYKQQPRRLPEQSAPIPVDTTLKYFPFGNIERIIDPELFDIYRSCLTKEILDLLKLHLSHEINIELSKEKYQEDRLSEYYKKDPEKFIESLIEIVNPKDEDRFGRYFVLEKDLRSPHRKKSIEREIVRDAIIKILSRPPFTYYKTVYESIFCYLTKKLDESLKNERLIKFADFRKFRFHTKRAVDLKSNFIVSKKFIKNIKEYYSEDTIERIKRFHEKSLKNLDEQLADRKINENYYKAAQNNVEYKLNQLTSYFFDLFYYFKQLMFMNPSLSIRFEELLNDKDLLPEGMNSSNASKDDLKRFIADPYFQFWWMIKAENVYPLDELKKLHTQNVKEQINLHKSQRIPDFLEYKGIRRSYFRDQKNDPKIVYSQKFNRASILDNNPETRRLSDLLMTYRTIILQSYRVFPMISPQIIINYLLLSQYLEAYLYKYGQLKYSTGKMLFTISTLKRNQMEDRSQDDEIREILNSIVEIIRPTPKSQINYAFFVKFENKVEDGVETKNIYSITSDKKSGNFDIQLDRKGLVYNLLQGLYDDKDSPNAQTLIAGIKLDKDKFVSFKDNYFYENTDKNLEPVSFAELYKNDLFNAKTTRGIELLNSANMSLFIRFATLSKEANNEEVANNYKLNGQAVLLITTGQNSDLNNFKRFMSNEKIRLLLLIKEELLEYLKKQFDNQSFFEVLKNKRNTEYSEKLKHDLRDNLNLLDRLNNESYRYNKKSEGRNGFDFDKNKDLFNIILKVIRCQLLRDTPSKLTTKSCEFTKQELLDKFKLMFESELIVKRSIEFKEVDISEFNLDKIKTNDYAFTLIILELITNIKKYCPRHSQRDKGLSIRYDEQENTICFKNIINRPSDESLSKSESGGLVMCRDLLLENKLGSISHRKEDNYFIVELCLDN